jgi:hypothetical protein
VSPELIFSIAVIVGVLIRTVLPYLKKKIDDPTTKFDPKFGYTAILALITTGIEMAAFLAEDPYILANLPPRLAALSGFFFGIGNNEILNRILHK